MDWFTGIIVFLLIWWTALFAVLPFGLKRDEYGKPLNLSIKRKFVMTTLVSFVIWLMVYSVIKMDVIDFRELSERELFWTG